MNKEKANKISTVLCYPIILCIAYWLIRFITHIYLKGGIDEALTAVAMILLVIGMFIYLPYVDD